MVEPEDEEATPLPEGKSVPLIVIKNKAQLTNAKAILASLTSSPFFPIFVIGSQGKSTLLESLTDIENSFASEEGGIDGVYAWPHTVKNARIPLLLLKLRRPPDEESIELRRKISAIFMALSSAVCICEDSKATTLETMEAIASDYRHLQAKCRVSLSKVFVFTQNSYFRSANDRKKLNELIEANPNLFDIRIRCPAGSGEDIALLAQFSSELSQPTLHEQYLISHSDIYQTNYQARFMLLLDSMIKIANIDLSFETFLERLPNFRAANEEIISSVRYAEDLKATSLPEPKSVPLIVIEKDEAQLSDGEAILAQFLNSSPFYPIFVIGSQGKSTLLESFTGIENSFALKEGGIDGVYAWPHTAENARIPLLLLKLRRHIDEESIELRRKISAIFMALSSAMCICEDSRATTLETMEAIASDYHEVQAKYGVSMSKVFVLIQQPWFNRASDKKQLNALMAANQNLFEIKTRGSLASREDRTFLDQFVSELGRVTLHEQYLQSHGDIFQGNFRTRFLSLLDSMLKIANFHYGFETFLKKLPDLRATDEEINKYIKKMQKKINRDANTQNGQVQPFIIKKKTQGVWVSVFQESTLEVIQTNYQLDKPIAVLAIMGPQGCGKSTLLNSLVQFCTESSATCSMFKTGNEGDHTTRGSMVLSHPLFWNKKQIMLIDLEGLGAAETRDQVLAMAQINLVRAIMTISSVLAIIVKNEYEKMVKLGDNIEMLNELHQMNHFRTKRVCVVFHDVNLEAPPNSGFKDTVDSLNRTVFPRQKPVITMLNKPNLVSREVTDEVRAQFLERFLDNCCHFKKYTKDYNGGSCVDVQKLLAELAMIAKNDSTSLEALHRTKEEESLCDRFVAEKTEQMRHIAKEIKSQDDSHLVCFFESELEKSFNRTLGKDFVSQRPVIFKFCNLRLDIEKKAICTELASIESCYQAMKRYPLVYMKEILQRLIDYRYQKAWTVEGFNSSLEVLEKILIRIQKQFPQAESRAQAISETTPACKAIKEIIQFFAEKKKNKVVRYWLTYGTQAAAGVVTGGVGFAATSTTTAITWGIVAGIRTTVVAVSVAAPLIGSIGYDACAASLVIAKANELLYVDSIYGNGTINTNVLKLLKANRTTPAPVLLCIGSKATCVADFASSFIRCISPFTPTEFDAFDPDKYTQILSFEYTHPRVNAGTQACTVFVICLRQAQRETEKYGRIMTTLAETLLPAASLTCVLADEPDSYYLNKLLGPLQPLPQSSSSGPQPSKLMLWQSYDDDLAKQVSFTPPTPVLTEIKHIQRFDKSTVAAQMEQIKREFDQVQVRNAGVLLERVEALPRSVQGLRF